MSKIQKTQRFETILKILNEERGPQSIREICEKLKASGIIVSVTTLKKDLKDLLESELIHHNGPTSESFSARPGDEFSFKLSNQEATFLMVVLPESDPINQRIRKMMGII